MQIVSRRQSAWNVKVYFLGKIRKYFKMLSGVCFFYPACEVLLHKCTPQPLILIELGFYDTSTLVGHFVSSPREREKRDRRDSRGDKREGQGRKGNRNESEVTEEILKTSSLYPYLFPGKQALPNCKPISVGLPSEVSYTTPSPHPTTLQLCYNTNAGIQSNNRVT